MIKGCREPPYPSILTDATMEKLALAKFVAQESKREVREGPAGVTLMRSPQSLPPLLPVWRTPKCPVHHGWGRARPHTRSAEWERAWLCGLLQQESRRKCAPRSRGAELLFGMSSLLQGPALP